MNDGQTRNMWLKKFSVIVLLTCFTILQTLSQSGMIISAGSSVFIRSGAIFSMDSLILLPSADFSLNGLNAETRNAIITHPAPQAHIQRVFHLINSLQSFSGSISIYYQDTELNGLPENGLTLNIHNSILWNNYSQNVLRDGNNNFVTTSGLQNINMEEFTLAALDAPLPIVFGLFKSVCNSGSVTLTWITEEETNADNFSIESAGLDGKWQSIGKIPANGNSSISQMYTYTDYTFKEQSFYRIVESDLDGRQSIGPTIISSCKVAEAIAIYPNPVSVGVHIAFSVVVGGPLILSLYDDKGSLVRQLQDNLMSGRTQMTFDLSGLATGIYFLHIVWGKNSEIHKIIKE